jgi:hypothetical protein
MSAVSKPVGETFVEKKMPCGNAATAVFATYLIAFSLSSGNRFGQALKFSARRNRKPDCTD